MKALSTENNIRVWKGKYFVVEHIRMCQIQECPWKGLNFLQLIGLYASGNTQTKQQSKTKQNQNILNTLHRDLSTILTINYYWYFPFHDQMNFDFFFFLQQSFCNRGGKKDTQREEAQVLTHSPRQTLQKVLLEITAWLSVDWMKQSLSLSTLYLEKYLFSLNTVSSCSHVLINSKILLSIVQL